MVAITIFNFIIFYIVQPIVNYSAIPLIVIGCFSIINQAIYFTYFWQLKEYRLDRMNDFLRTKSGLAKFFPHFWGARIVGAALIAMCVLWLRLNNSAILWNGPSFYGMMLQIAAQLLIIVAGFWEVADFVIRLKKKKLYRPERTSKALLVLFFTVAPLLLLFAAYCYWAAQIHNLYPWLAIFVLWLIDLAVFPFNALVVFLFWPVTLIEKNRTIARASQKVAQMQGLKVIAITGSYGKSSTKDFLAAILESKFKVLKTPGNTNTDIGVAGIVLTKLKPEHEVFIVEAGAYKIGEIKKIVDLVKPRIGIVTAVKDAHLGLFGSLENIKKAKFELIEGLPEFGTGIFNADSQGALDLAGRAERRKLAKVITYSTSSTTTELKNDAGKNLNPKAENIKVEQEKVSFEVNGVKFELMVCGAQNVPNALAAICGAQEMGLKLEEMVEPLRQAKLRDHTMNLKKASDDLWLVDDTYNANPDGVVAGLDYLKLFEDREKIIVFPGMIELGEKTFAEHVRVAEKIGEVCDMAIFTSSDFEEPIREGLKNFDEKKYAFIETNQKAIWEKLTSRIQGKKAVVLFVSRGSELVINHLISGKNAW